MKIFVDTAEIEEIKRAVSWMILDGVTTNPSLIKKAVEARGGKLTMEGYIKDIVKITPGPVSLEVIGGTADEMIEEGVTLYERFSSHGEVAIKIPVNPSMDGDDGLDFEGLRAINRLSKKGIPVNVTLIMTPEQALLAAKAGAAYVSPFAGRIDDYIRSKLGMKGGSDFQKTDYFDYGLLRRIRDLMTVQKAKNFNLVAEVYKRGDVRALSENGQDSGVLSGVDLVAKILRIYRNYGLRTEVIAASIRNPRQAREMAELGVHIATLPFNVIEGMIRHYKTAEGMRSFNADVVPQYREIFERK